jgi:hypothetical protein
MGQSYIVELEAKIGKGNGKDVINAFMFVSIESNVIHILCTKQGI